MAELREQSRSGRRTFQWSFQKVTHNSVVEYKQRVKIEATKNQLAFGRSTKHTVMYGVGYIDIKTLRDVLER